MNLKRFITLIFVFCSYTYASLIGSNFSQSDLQILEDLDIKSSFITDYKLQQTYEKYLIERNSKHYVKKLNAASLFVPRVKDILRQEGIPDVFIFMAMAESDFTINARSRVKATGLWQFMHGTAKRYGLRNDIYVDERMDLVKSTFAATKYLNRLNKMFDKWYLAAIAYNCGEGRLIEGITRATIDMYVEQNPKMAKSKKIKEYRQTIRDYQQKRVRFSKVNKIYKEVKKWGIKPDIEQLLLEQTKIKRQYVPKESRGYIRKIISLAMMNSQSFIKEKDNSHLLNLGISTTIATIPVKGGLHLRNIAKAINMDYAELKKLNSHIKQGIIPPTDLHYTINIPYSRLAKFQTVKSDIVDTKYAIHIVKRGETLSGIGKRYKISYKLIKNYNRLKSSKLSLKQKIIIPIPSDMIVKKTKILKKARKTKTVKLAKASKKGTKSHKVKSGDTLYSIARNYNVNLKKLMEDNNLESSFLKIGDRIVIR